MKHKNTIQVRRYLNGKAWYNAGPEDVEIVETISRKLWSESIGNFCPVFCRYKGKRCLVQSDKGDLSDPFRATPDYANNLWIAV